MLQHHFGAAVRCLHSVEAIYLLPASVRLAGLVKTGRAGKVNMDMASACDPLTTRTMPTREFIALFTNHFIVATTHSVIADAMSARHLKEL